MGDVDPVEVAGHGLVAVEATFGAGTMLAPMAGARLLRFVGRLEDPWANGLHVEGALDAESVDAWLSTWSAFERPGRARWSAAPGVALDEVRARVPDDLLVSARPVLRGAVSAGAAAEAPEGVGIAPITADIRDWAGFEVLARWIDLDEDPGIWRWRASRVRHLVEGGRGRAWLARTTAAPIGALVLLDPPEHHHADPALALPSAVVVVHQAHRGRGVARALLTAALAASGGSPGRTAVVLGDGAGHLVEVGRALGLSHVEDLVEVGVRPGPSSRKA